MGLSKNLNYAYYPGCAAKQIQKEADWSARAIADKLDIKLHDMPAATCCGAGKMQEHDLAAALAVNARIFSQAEEMGMDIVTICNTCLQTFAFANERLKNEPELLEKINNVLIKAGVRPYEGTIDVKHLVWVLVDDIGVEKVKKHVSTPLNGMKVAPFYGCHSLRPNEIFNGRGGTIAGPAYLDKLIAAIGGEEVDYFGKDKCCGFHTMLENEKDFLHMSGGHAQEAKQAGADVMVSPCTLCDMAIGAYQSRAEKVMGEKIGLPEMNITQLIGAAMGIDSKTLGLNRLHQDIRPALKQYQVEIR
ncbi:MAG: CoB--CoM heterodisulfide reductase iron-sulfur subunit B family protein [Alphaproteobacteria bacterium]|nr:CoB--CoM heterodisulfide reductase iron-sulfur subunit B family protein [Alphaproteobacteria bacterium]MDD9919993.1 CoB--CoM heterodisulfide reductase iron-sulfur subunit B family protein [Alphaproteobacteria bacterium]